MDTSWGFLIPLFACLFSLLYDCNDMNRTRRSTKHPATQTYAVIVQPDDFGGFWASCPSLTGCYSQGDSIEETLKNIKEAIELSAEEMPKSRRKSDPLNASLHLVTV
jgi:predicted RNase H-like HicB family nuclease